MQNCRCRSLSSSGRGTVQRINCRTSRATGLCIVRSVRSTAVAVVATLYTLQQWWRPCTPSSTVPPRRPAPILGTCTATKTGVEIENTASCPLSSLRSSCLVRRGWCSSWRRSRRWRRRCCEHSCGSGRSPTARKRCDPACLPRSVLARWSKRQDFACTVAGYLRQKGLPRTRSATTDRNWPACKVCTATSVHRICTQLLCHRVYPQRERVLMSRTSCVFVSPSASAEGKGLYIHRRSAAAPGRSDRSGSRSLMRGMQ